MAQNDGDSANNAQSGQLPPARMPRKVQGGPVFAPPEEIALEKVPKHLLSRVRAKMAEIPPRFRLIYARGMGGARQPAIKANCAECAGWLVAEVRKCTVRTCPFYRYRPWKEKT